jgi:hypothetical protein
MSGDRCRRVNRWRPERSQDSTFGGCRLTWAAVGMAVYLAVMLGFYLI